MMSNVWEQTAEHYEAHYLNQYKRADTLEKQLLTKLLKQFPNAENLLEVGCGTAHFTKWINTTGLECYGIDQSSGMLREAKKLWSHGNLLKSEGSYLPFQDKSVDIVAFITSLEFMQDPNAALIEACRVARKGILLGLLNKNSFATLKRKLQPKKQDSVYSQAKLYSISDIQETLDKAIPEKHTIAFWSTTVFPPYLGGLESNLFPFGDFLGVAVKLQQDNTND